MPQPHGGCARSTGDLLRLFSDEVALPRFVAALGEALPVIDGGVHRRAVDDCVDVPPASAGDATRLSASLSLALLRLKDEGLIDLRRVSDSPDTRALSVRAGHQATYSHARILIPQEAVA